MPEIYPDATYEIAPPDRLLGLLRAKLTEEVDEFLADNDPDELVDILEVVINLAAALGVDPAELARRREAKLAARGGFAGRIVWRHHRRPAVLPLTALTTLINALPDLSEDTRIQATRALWPELVALAGDARVAEDTRINLITEACRASLPTAARADSPRVALATLRHALERLTP
jgi:predicted house-cleaning noncanonical NTP pyrophosphatase (MazG superfamily)